MLKAYIKIINIIENFNTVILRFSRTLAWIAIGLMVIVMLVQVFFRYVLNNALPWPDEASRFLMLWMTGLMAPSAYRWGEFIAIDLLRDQLMPRLLAIFDLCLHFVALIVLIVALSFALKHIDAGWIWYSTSLKLPLNLIGQKATPINLAWMYMSIPIGFFMVVLVIIEMILKGFHKLFDPKVIYKVPDNPFQTKEQ